MDRRPWKHWGGHFSSAAGIPFLFILIFFMRLCIFTSAGKGLARCSVFDPHVQVNNMEDWQEYCMGLWVGGGSSLTHSRFPSADPSSPPHPPLPRGCPLAVTGFTSAGTLPQLSLNCCFLSLFLSASLSVYPPTPLLSHNEVILMWKKRLCCLCCRPTFSPGRGCVWASFVLLLSFPPPSDSNNICRSSE